MTTFDGTAPPAYGEPTQFGEDPAPPEQVLDDIAPVDALELLRQEVSQREAEEQELFPVEIPGLGWRLMCSLEFTSAQWESWQRLAIPKNKRRRPSPIDIQQGVLAELVLVNTCEGLEYRDKNDEWQTLSGHDGEPLTLESDELLRKFGQMSARSMLQKLFRRDAHLLRAGQDVISAAGYGDPDEEAGGVDPTE